MGANRRLIIHVGLEKTGTSSLQACLFRNEAMLARHAVVYPRRNLAFGWQNHKPLVGCYGIEEVGDKWLAIDPSRRARVVASLVDEIERSRHQTAVISAEHFSSRFGERQIRELHADFGRFDCRIVFVLRDHFSRLCSAYETYVSNSGAFPIDDFAEGLIRPAALDMRYADLVAPWVDVFRRERVTLVPYGPNALRQVLNNIAPGLGSAVVPGRHANVSVRPEVVAAMRLANHAVAEFGPQSNARWVRQSHLRARMKALLSKTMRDEPVGAWCFSPDLFARLTEIARLDKAELESRYGFVFEDSAPPENGIGEVEFAGAVLLARALHAGLDRPWTKASLGASALALVVTMQDEFDRIRRRLDQAMRRRASRQSVG